MEGEELEGEDSEVAGKFRLRRVSPRPPRSCNEYFNDDCDDDHDDDCNDNDDDDGGDDDGDDVDEVAGN